MGEPSPAKIGPLLEEALGEWSRGLGAQCSDPEQYASRGGNASMRWNLLHETQLTVLQQARLGGISAGNSTRVTGERPTK